MAQSGCGVEAPLEAWYRLLVDPKPYAEIVPTSCSTGQPEACGMCRGPNGMEHTVLSQRTANYDAGDCMVAEDANNPLCQAPDGSHGKVQYRTKTWPSPHILNVFTKIPSQPVVTSICAPQLPDPTRVDCDYRQVITALVEHIRRSL